MIKDDEKVGKKIVVTMIKDDKKVGIKMVRMKIVVRMTKRMARMIESVEILKEIVATPSARRK